MASVLIIYGSSGGNTELTCEKVKEVLESKGVKTQMQRVELSKIDDLKKADLVVLAAPTYEHGVIQMHFIPFLKELKKVDLKQKPMAVIGLGDPKYDDHYHIESANVLTTAIKKSNGNTVMTALRVSRSPLLQLETRIKTWAENLAKILTIKP